jgi:hypothetical protein
LQTDDEPYNADRQTPAFSPFSTRNALFTALGEMFVASDEGQPCRFD